MRNSNELMINAWNAGTVIPAFNVAHLPMMEPVVRALRETRCFGLVAVSRIDWEKFGAGGIRDIYDRYQQDKHEGFTRLHLDHVPVIDEDGKKVDYEAVLASALDLGYESVMVDGSRLPLEENIAATKKIVAMSHERGVPVEAELGAVLGHEEGPLPPYEQLFASGRGFTDPGEAQRFVRETGVDWLSVAIGNIHGAVAPADRGKQKIAARLNIEHLRRIRETVSRPLVLHGGSGIQKAYLIEAFENGIAKLNVGTIIRQVYEQGAGESVRQGQENVYRKMLWLIREELGVEGSRDVIDPEAG